MRNSLMISQTISPASIIIACPAYGTTNKSGESGVDNHARIFSPSVEGHTLS